MGTNFSALLSRGAFHRTVLEKPLQQLACAAGRENFTLLHAGSDPLANSAIAL